MWNALFQVADVFPMEPSEEMKQRAERLLHGLTVVTPCSACCGHMKEYVEKHPVASGSASRAAFLLYLRLLFNDIQARAGGAAISVEDVANRVAQGKRTAASDVWHSLHAVTLNPEAEDKGAPERATFCMDLLSLTVPIYTTVVGDRAAAYTLENHLQHIPCPLFPKRGSPTSTSPSPASRLYPERRKRGYMYRKSSEGNGNGRVPTVLELARDGYGYGGDADRAYQVEEAALGDQAHRTVVEEANAIKQTASNSIALWVYRARVLITGLLGTPPSRCTSQVLTGGADGSLRSVREEAAVLPCWPALVSYFAEDEDAPCSTDKPCTNEDERSSVATQLMRRKRGGGGGGTEEVTPRCYNSASPPRLFSSSIQPTSLLLVYLLVAGVFLAAMMYELRSASSLMHPKR